MISASGTYRNITELPARRFVWHSRGVVLGGIAVVAAAMRERCPFVEEKMGSVVVVVVGGGMRVWVGRGR